MPLIEGELSFEFSGSLSEFRLDERGKARPHGLKLVDFVVEEGSRRLLVEVKDPSARAATPARRADWAMKLKTKQLIVEELVPKARGSYLYLHLMALDDKPFVAVIVVGIEQVPIDPALLAPFKDRLRARLEKEAPVSWKRQYISDCAVLHLGNWSTFFPGYALARI